jgi:hypothetical protein
VTRRRSSIAIANRIAIAITALLLAQIGAYMHQTSVQHVRCGHGELVEATVVAKYSTDLSRIVGVETKADAGDEHCVIATGVRGDARVSAPSMVVHRAIVEQPVVVSQARVVVTGALYRTAPKTSPPNVA